MEPPAPAAEVFMNAALDMARRALADGEVPVGCVFVEGDQIVGRGCNRTVVKRNGTRHAELEAIDAMQEAGFTPERFASIDLYVTIEPCVMCAAALLLLGIRKVYYGAGNDKFGGCGSVFRLHTERTIDNRRRGYAVQAGVCQAQAVELLKQFYAVGNPNGACFCCCLKHLTCNSAPVPHRKAKSPR